MPRNVRPLHYSISAVPDAANLRFTGRTDVDIEVLEATDSITLNAAELEFGEVFDRQSRRIRRTAARAEPADERRRGGADRDLPLPAPARAGPLPADPQLYGPDQHPGRRPVCARL